MGVRYRSIKNKKMDTRIIEFSNAENQKLRGIITIPNDEIKIGVLCLHGFERCATTEKKFKSTADVLLNNHAATLRFDFSGCGLSDGDFKFTTIEKQGIELINAIEVFQREIKITKVSIIAHSLGACVLANQLQKINNKIDKIVLLSPALNQKELLRYWFVAGQMKKTNPSAEINWHNYKEHFIEEDFLSDCAKNGKTTKANYINPEYFLSGKDLDYSNTFLDSDYRILHVHGNKDLAVPFDSLNIKFINQIIVDGGDHDLEKPNQLDQWLPKVVSFLLS